MFTTTRPAFSPSGAHLGFLRPAAAAAAAPAAHGAVAPPPTQELWTLACVPGAAARPLATPSGGQGDTDANLPLEERLRRERSRQLAQGITSFSWLSDTRLLFPQQGSLLTLELPAEGAEGAAAAPRVAVDCASLPGGAGCIDAQPSPDGRLVAFVQDRELYVAELSSASEPSAPLQLSCGARERTSCSHGLADFISEEEFDRHTGFWWSPCGRYIAYQRTEDAHVPPFRIAHAGDDAPGAEEVHRYPFAGQRNAIVGLAVVDVSAALRGGAAAAPPTVWMQLGPDDDIYVVRVTWMPAPEAGSTAAAEAAAAPALCVQLLNRAQSVIDVVRFDVDSGRGTLLLREVAPASAWINVHDCLAFVARPRAAGAAAAGADAKSTSLGYFLWASERSGFQHLYLYAFAADGASLAKRPQYSGPPRVAPAVAAAGGDEGDSLGRGGAGAGGPAGGAARLVRQVTGGAWLVESVAHVGPSPAAGEAGVSIYFLGTLDGALEKHLYAVPLVFTAPGEASDAASERAGAMNENLYGISQCRRLTSGSGMHNAVVSRDGRTFADSLSSLHCAPSLAVLRFDPAARFPTSPLAKGPAVPALAGASPGGLLASIGAASPSGSAVAQARISAGGGDGIVRSRLFAESDASPSVSPRTGSGAGAGGSGLSQTLQQRLALVRGAQSFERTGAYGPRVSVGVSLLAVVIGVLPECGGTPPAFVGMVEQLRAAAEAAECSSNSSGASAAGNTFAAQLQHSLATPMQVAVGGFAAAVSSVSSRLDAVSAGVNAQLKRADVAMGAQIESIGSRFANFGVQAGALLAGMAVPEATSHAGPPAAAAATAPPTPAPAPRPVAVASTPALAPTPTPAVVATPQSALATSSTPALSPPPSPPAPSLAPSSAQPPILVSVLAADGSTPLFAALFLPDPAVHGRGPYPLVVSVYGGPHVMRVKHDFSTTNEQRAQALRREGVLVAVVDNRGGSRRGVAFEAFLRRRMGDAEVEDQAALVRALVTGGIADGSRVGCYGWSYGGYMTLMMLAKRSDIFSVGVAGAPVTSWDGYDTAYTERYMGDPATNAAAYAESSVMTHARGISGHLLLVHGMVDENVHARHTFRLLKRLAAVNVPHELLLFPSERHVPRDAESKAFMERRIRAFLLRHLLPRRA